MVISNAMVLLGIQTEIAEVKESEKLVASHKTAKFKDKEVKKVKFTLAVNDL